MTAPARPMSQHWPASSRQPTGDADAFLRANDAAYRWALARAEAIDAQRHPEAALQAVARAAGLAGAFHGGRFADGALEHIALGIGRHLQRGQPPLELPWPLPARRSGRRVLHVASQLAGAAGHARMLDHWIRNDPDSCHSLVVTRQPQRTPVPPWLQAAIALGGGHMAVLPADAPLLAQAQWLRGVAQRAADLVVLHHDGHDVLPSVAFATADGPPVAVLNHADHQFWLGSAVADCVINLRSIATPQAAARRFIYRSAVLPVPLADRHHETPARQRAQARQALGLADSDVLLLSVGRAVKYRPCGAYDFVAAAGRLLDRLPQARLVIVGETAAGIAPHLRATPHPRLQFAGSTDDVGPWHLAADVYLESFPFGSQTALLEAALAGLPVVPGCAPLSPLLVANDDAVCALLPNPPSEAAWIERGTQLAGDAAQRRAFGHALRESLRTDHLGAGWRARLRAIYQDTDVLQHRPHPVPQTDCIASAADIGLSLWHVAADGRREVPCPPGMAAQAAAAHAAYVARLSGDVAGARRHAWRALRLAPRAASAWTLLGIALLGEHAGAVRRLLDRAVRPRASAR